MHIRTRPLRRRVALVVAALPAAAAALPQTTASAGAERGPSGGALSTRTKATTTPTCADGYAGAVSPTAAPAAASSPRSGWDDTTGPSNAPWPGSTPHAVDESLSRFGAYRALVKSRHRAL